MALTRGTRLGSFEILSPIGAGGMGEVYRARDTRLGRQVAIKVLPAEFAQDPARRIRFEREARAVSALNHPHICTLHDIGQQDGVDYLVMEYLEGETLADRVQKGALPLPQVLRIGSQIADALDKAHRAGIVHRDLKPGNVMLTKSGAKLLDFGLARVEKPAETGGGLSMLPTQAKPLTEEGNLLGTLQYMAPEQLEGKEIDARTDIFAFGAVVYEMGTGKKAFEGKSQASLIVAILEHDPPPMSSLAPMAPSALDRAVKKCLAKEPEKRWQAASDLNDELTWIAEGMAHATASFAAPINRARLLRRWALVTALICLAAIVTTGVTIWNLRSAPSAPVRRFAVPLPPGGRFTALNWPSLALSPDGDHLVYITGVGGVQQLYLRSMDSFEAMPVPGTEGAFAPFFSPDSQSVGFFAGGKLKKVSISGGAAVTLTDVPAPWGATWGPKDTIVYAPSYDAVLLQISSSGGTPQPLTTVDRKSGERGHEWPEFLPDGNAIVFTVPTQTGVTWDDSLIEVQSLDTGKRRVLIQGGTYPRYVPSGHLVFIRSGTLMAVPFDLKRLEVTGSPVPIIAGVAEAVAGVGQFSFSRFGTLVYIPGSSEGAHRRLVWVDRGGSIQALPLPPQPYLCPRLSPDGRRAVVWLSRLNCDAMVFDIARETLDRLTFAGDNHGPTWTPDGKRITFHSQRQHGFNLFWTPADGSGPAEQLAGNEHPADGLSSLSWSPEGKVLAYVEFHAETVRDIWLLSLDSDRKARPFLQSAFNEDSPAFSPDGHWLAYVSDESGRLETYVQPFPGPGGKWLISTDGGTEPVWNRNGRELFYRNGEKMMAVEITSQPWFSPGKPKMLFESESEIPPPYATFPNYDVSPDGKRFLMVKDSEQEAKYINVVVNWFEELKRRVPTEK